MAANDYYHSFKPESSQYEEQSTFHHPYGEEHHSSVPYADGEPAFPEPHDQAYRNSQNSLLSDDHYDRSGGVATGDEPYADSIPLRANARQAYGPSPWAEQNRQHRQEVPITPGANTQHQRRRKRSLFKKRIAWVTYLLTVIDIGVFIGELVRSAQLTGSPIETKPTFNPMIGPSPYIQIYMGARFIPCMKNVPGIQDNNVIVHWNCPNSTSSNSNDPSNQCTLSDLCGFGGVPNPHVGGSLNDQPQPNQWFRFIIPMFLHGGIVHIGFNMLVQMTMGADMERMIGWWRYAVVYLASGIFGFVLGGNYAAQGITSTGASGSLFGILALFILDLLYTWSERRSPWVELIIMLFGVGLSFVLGLLPGLDNFSHIGGFIMGLALGLCILRSPNLIRERIGLARTPYVIMGDRAGPSQTDEEDKGRNKMVDGRLLSFFQGRKPLWWAWWLVRAGALVAVLIGFIILLTNFYKYPKSNCSWCYRLSCLPVNNWCSIGNLSLTQSN